MFSIRFVFNLNTCVNIVRLTNVVTQIFIIHILIFRHAKRVHEEASRDRVLGMASPKIPIATVAARMEQQQNSTSKLTILTCNIFNVQ